MSITILYIAAEVNYYREQYDDKALFNTLISPKDILGWEIHRNYTSLTILKARVIILDKNS